MVSSLRPSQLDLVRMSQQPPFITAFVFLELLLCAGMCLGPAHDLHVYLHMDVPLLLLEVSMFE